MTFCWSLESLESLVSPVKYGGLPLNDRTVFFLESSYAALRGDYSPDTIVDDPTFRLQLL